MDNHVRVIASNEPEAPLCSFVDVGLVELDAAEALMESLGSMRIAGEIEDAVLFLSHPKTISVGCKAARFPHPPDLLVPFDRLEGMGIDFVRSVRGGGITYHWPGQTLCYPVMALCPEERDVGRYMRKLEEVAQMALRKFGVETYRRRDTPAHIGLWHEGRKIASMGVRVSRWVTAFGFALNIEGDLSPSKFIRPCGIKDARLVSLENILTAPPPRGAVIDAVRDAFTEVFHRKAQEISETLRKRLLVWNTSRTNGAATGWKT